MKKSGVISVFAGLVLGFVILFILCWYSNGFESFSPLYLKYAGSIVQNEIDIGAAEAVIEVKSAGFSAIAPEYTVKIEPNAAADFDYTADGENYRFSAAGDLTDCFDIEQNGASFVLSPSSCGLETVLSIKHKTDVTIGDLPQNVNFYILTVTSASGDSVTAELCFGVVAISISPETIIIF